MSECRYCGGECETSDEYMCDGYAGDIDNLYGDDDGGIRQMNDYWFLCRDTGTIKYFGSFVDYDEADAYLLSHGLDPAWIFSELPKVETPVGGEYNMVLGDLVTVEVTGSEAEATISGCPEGIEVEVHNYE